ncbi:hypothetical protein TMM008_05930 [Pseudomonas sp. 008]|nr:hypothetical protein TMM008_05930 [Pseudomonas sp. 008]
MVFRLDKDEEHIEYVRVRKDGLGDNFVVPRGFVAQLITSGIPFKAR